MDQRKCIAKKRWRMLVDTLSGKRAAPATENEFSVRRFSSYGLLHTTKLSTKSKTLKTVSSSNKDKHNNFSFYSDKIMQKCGENLDHVWYQYTSEVNSSFKPVIRHLVDAFSPNDLLGFNNTGNVCVWPAEEVLTYYCLNNPELFYKKKVLELGGGMTCLAGLAVATTSKASEVVLTDGNEKSVANLSLTVDRNSTIPVTSKRNFSEIESGLKISDCKVSCHVLRWDDIKTVQTLKGEFDVIICADCLFFEDGRQDLVNAFEILLKIDGVAVIFAPPRGKTLDIFVKLALNKFKVERETKYDNKLWDQHLKLLASGKESYDSDIHYPIMITLTKT